MTTDTKRVYRVDLKREHQKYLDSEGREYPGASTISGLFPKYLDNWIAKVEREHVLACISANRHDLGAYAYVQLRDSAADAGTVAHVMAEAWVNGCEFDPEGIAPDTLKLAQGGFDNFRRWWEGCGYSLIASERQFVLPDPGFGGTVDLVAQHKSGKVHLVDLKTSKAIYDNHRVQVGGYDMGCERAIMPVDAVLIARIGKGDAQFREARDVETMSPARREWARRTFLACLGLWKNLKAPK